MLCAATAAHAQDSAEGAAPFRDTYGEVGLIETPSARMADDGQLSLSVGALEKTTRVSFGFQLFPWLEGSFRYSSISNFNGNVTDFDRSFGMKMRLFQESEYMPDVSLGIRDIIGTGIYGSEYLVATKSIWQFDVTAGLGWGRLAGDGTFDNPFGALFSSFKVRKEVGGTNGGGQVDFGQFFHGPDMGLFGGVVWHTPIPNVNLVAEYSPDNYKREQAAGVIHIRTPVNVGIEYRPLSMLTITGGWLYGTSWGAIMSLALDPTRDQAPARVGTQPIPVTTRTDEQRRDAVQGYVTQETKEEEIAQGSPFVGHRAGNPDAGVTLVSQVNNSSAAVRDAEIDGRTLVVDVRSGAVNMDACKRYALLAAASSAPVDSVAVIDLTKGKVEPLMCQTPRQELPRTIYARLEQMDSFADTTNVAGGDSPAAPAPPVMQIPLYDRQTVENNLRAMAQSQGLRVEGVGIGAHQIVVYYSNSKYFMESDAIGRMARVLLATTPPDVESLKLVAVVSGVPQQQIVVQRAPLERMFLQGATPAEIDNAMTFEPPPLDHPVLDAGQANSYPRFNWSLSPVFRQELFDPNEPVQVQLLASVAASVEILPGWSVSTNLEGNIYNDFNFSRTSNSVLPHVRSDFAEYLQHGINGISSLYTSYDTRVAPDTFIEFKAGYLEDMFAGAGVEVLWRPEALRWAIGGDLYAVQQRGFQRLFALRDYQVITGHVTVYYQSPWYDLNFAVHAGRYLAGDYGATFEVTREFSTGVEIGAFATFTNVPFSKFGEGSFDKGIIIRIPLEWALPFNTQSAYNMDLRPLTRDGGQRLVNDDSLYDETRRTSYGEIENHIEEIGNP